MAEHTAEKGAPEVGSRSECTHCGEPIEYGAVDGWFHPAMVGVGVLGGDGVACDWTPVAEPGPTILPPQETEGGAEGE